VCVAVAALYTARVRLELLDNRALLVLAALLAVAGAVAWSRRARAPAADRVAPETRRIVVAAAIGGAATLTLVVARVLLTPGAPLRDRLLGSLPGPLLGWSAMFFLWASAHTDAGERAASREHDPRWTLFLAAYALLAIWLASLAVRHWVAIDEVLYVLQANLFARGELAWRLDPALRPFFELPLMFQRPEGIITQYPPGYPAVLAVFLRLGVPALSGAVLGAVAVLATYRLGRSVAAASVGFLAAALLATHELLVARGSLLMSHVAGMAVVATAAALLLSPRDDGSRARLVRMLAAGLLIGAAFAMRPVTGVALGLSLWLWAIIRSWGRWRDVGIVTASLVLGALIPAIAFLAYNARTTGSPLRLGYNAVSGSLANLGFGMRGMILLGPTARLVTVAEPFTLAAAARNEVVYVLWPLARDLLPMWTIVPLLAAAFAYRVRIRWSVVAAFAVLPVIQFFYVGNVQRYYAELLPFVLLGVAFLVYGIAEREPRFARALTVFFVAGGVVGAAGIVAGALRERTAHPDAAIRIAGVIARAPRGPNGLLVFVDDSAFSQPLLLSLAHVNFGRFPGPVVVARDLGAEDARLVCRLPGRRVLFAEAATPDHDVRLVERPPAPPPAPCDPSLPPLVPPPR
jgi:4-amino-4-deoxy-L-arabinose transferase-like glycosyltransferase